MYYIAIYSLINYNNVIKTLAQGGNLEYAGWVLRLTTRNIRKA